MPTILKTDAIVLRSYHLGETSKIIVLYTRNYGKIRVVGKGSRKLKSKFGGHLEPFSQISVVYYYKETRELQTLSESALIRPFSKIRDDLTKFSIASAIVELFHHVVPYEETNIPLFKLIQHILDALNDAEKNLMNLFFYFQIHLATLAGYKLGFDHCAVCNTSNPNGNILFHIDSGGIICEDCSKKSNAGGIKLSSESVKILERLQISTPQGITSIHPTEKALFEISELLIKYYRFHIEGIHELKSLAVLEKIDRSLPKN